MRTTYPILPGIFPRAIQKRWKRAKLPILSKSFEQDGPILLPSPHPSFEPDRPDLSFSPAAEQFTMRRAHLIYGLLCLGDQFFFIHSTLVDQQLPDCYVQPLTTAIRSLFCFKQLNFSYRNSIHGPTFSYIILSQMFQQFSSVTYRIRVLLSQVVIKTFKLKTINSLTAVLFSSFHYNRKHIILLPCYNFFGFTGFHCFYYIPNQSMGIFHSL